MQVDVFQTLADPVRLRLVELLLDREQAVNDLVPQVGIHQSGVSRHLRILHEAGFVQVRPDGARRLYSLRSERFSELDDWVSRYRSLWEDRLTRLGGALARSQAAKTTDLKKKTTDLKKETTSG
jgi:DNA-binding transcriptional ArsR family regulator